MIKRALREERRPDIDPEPIQVSSVDGYQGEENKIIILSLVRSNTAGQIGFLKVVNRVCVSLSRAQHVSYIIIIYDFKCIHCCMIYSGFLHPW